MNMVNWSWWLFWQDRVKVQWKFIWWWNTFVCLGYIKLNTSTDPSFLVEQKIRKNTCWNIVFLLKPICSFPTASTTSATVALFHFLWFSDRVSFQMFPQIAWLNSCIIAMIAFVRFFSRMDFQMRRKVTSITRSIVTLVAFVQFFTRVNFHMSSQITCLDSCIVTLVASVWFFS